MRYLRLHKDGHIKLNLNTLKDQLHIEKNQPIATNEAAVRIRYLLAVRTYVVQVYLNQLYFVSIHVIGTLLSFILTVSAVRTYLALKLVFG